MNGTKESKPTPKLYLSKSTDSGGELSYTVIYQGSPLMASTPEKQRALSVLHSEAKKLKIVDVDSMWDGDRGEFTSGREALPSSITQMRPQQFKGAYLKASTSESSNDPAVWVEFQALKPVKTSHTKEELLKKLKELDAALSKFYNDVGI